MLDQEAAFVQIQEAKTMVEEDLQRRLEEFEDEKEQLQKMVASAAVLEQQLEQASTCWGSRHCPGATASLTVLICAGLSIFYSCSVPQLYTEGCLQSIHPDCLKPEHRKSKLLEHTVFLFKSSHIDFGSFFSR